MKDRICIILLNSNEKDKTLSCLNSLSKVNYSPFTTIVVDRGSIDDSVKAIRSDYPRVPIFETRKNIGSAEGTNVGIAWALTKPFQWILLLDNNTLIDPQFLSAFLECSRQYPNAKILGAKIYRASDASRIDHLGGAWNEKKAKFESLSSGKIDDGIYFEISESVDYVSRAALFMHRSVPETIGLLEPRFFHFGEEIDFCFRAHRKGFTTRTAPLAKVWSKGTFALFEENAQSHYFLWRSRLLWMERNLTPETRKHIMRTTLLPELFNLSRRYLLHLIQKGLQTLLRMPQKELKGRKIRYLRAGISGVFHYYLRKFDHCPNWLSHR